MINRLCGAIRRTMVGADFVCNLEDEHKFRHHDTDAAHSWENDGTKESWEDEGYEEPEEEQ